MGFPAYPRHVVQPGASLINEDAKKRLGKRYYEYGGNGYIQLAHVLLENAGLNLPRV